MRCIFSSRVCMSTHSALSKPSELRQLALLASENFHLAFGGTWTASANALSALHACRWHHRSQSAGTLPLPRTPTLSACLCPYRCHPVNLPLCPRLGPCLCRPVRVTVPPSMSRALVILSQIPHSVSNTGTRFRVECTSAGIRGMAGTQ